MSIPTPKEIREQYTDDLNAWKKIRTEGDKDMRCIGGDPWGALDPKGKKAREDAERPVIAPDELSQYINQNIGQYRQNKRGVKVEPAGSGATDKIAQYRQDHLRGIEYRSKAQQAYTTGFEGALQRGYGFIGLGRKFVSENSFDQELYVRRIPNPNSVVISPHYKDAVASDMDHGFIIERKPVREFAKEYGKRAEQTDFVGEEAAEIIQWIGEKEIQVGEYWHFRTNPTTLYLTDGIDKQGNPLLLKGSDFGKKGPRIEDGYILRRGKRFKIIRDRKIEQKVCWQMVTNGHEVLNEMQFGGPYIPIIPVFGREIFVDEGSGAERRLISLIRLARDPFMLYCYYRTCQAELVGMTPKTPYIGYEGQFADHEEDWQDVNKAPIPYLQVKPVMDATGQQVLPLPERQPYAPVIEPLETCAEAARRAIQSAIGVSQLPTAAQRRGEKSGKALERIEQQEAVGSFHFTDNFDNSLEQVGRILNWHLKPTYDSEGREVGLCKEDGTHEVIKVNTQYAHPETGEAIHYPTDVGEYDVIISTGPSFQSQREEAADFAGIVVQNIEQLPIAPPVKAKFFALIIKLKNLGPIGDAMVELLDPGDNSPQAALQQAQAQLAQMQQAIQEITQENQKLKLEKAGKVIDNEYALQMQTLNNDVKVLIAEIAAKNQETAERNEMYKTFWLENHKAAHEAGMQAVDHAHESGMADKNAAIASQQSAQDAAQQPEAVATQ